MIYFRDGEGGGGGVLRIHFGEWVLWQFHGMDPTDCIFIYGRIDPSFCWRRKRRRKRRRKSDGISTT